MKESAKIFEHATKVSNLKNNPKPLVKNPKWKKGRSLYLGLDLKQEKTVNDEIKYKDKVKT